MLPFIDMKYLNFHNSYCLKYLFKNTYQYEIPIVYCLLNIFCLPQ